MIRHMLEQVGVTQDDTILLHSDITAYAKENKHDLEECCTSIFNSLSSEYTWIVPTFNYDFSTYGKPFNLWETRSQVGWLTNWVLFNPVVSALFDRSFHPVFSFAGMWNDVNERTAPLLDGVSKDAFGINSVFDRLYNLNAKIVTLSVPATQMTFIHYIEQRLNVWYRYKKYFTGQVTKYDETWIDTFSIFVRDLEKNVQNNFGWAVDLWTKCGIIKRYSLDTNPDLFVLAVSCQDLFEVVRSTILQNENALITYKE